MCNRGKTACEVNCPGVIGTSLKNDLKSTDYMCTFFAPNPELNMLPSLIVREGDAFRSEVCDVCRKAIRQ